MNEDRKAYAGYALFISLLVALMFLNGCGKKPPTEAVRLDESNWQIPVESGKTTPVAGKDAGDELVTITVPASDRDTEIKVFKEKLNLLQSMFTNKPGVSLVAKSKPKAGTVSKETGTPAASSAAASEPPAVKGVVPEKKLFWRWAALGGVLLIFILAAALAVYSKLKGLSPWGVVTAIVKRVL